MLDQFLILNIVLTILSLILCTVTVLIVRKWYKDQKKEIADDEHNSINTTVPEQTIERQAQEISQRVENMIMPGDPEPPLKPIPPISPEIDREAKEHEMKKRMPESEVNKPKVRRFQDIELMT